MIVSASRRTDIPAFYAEWMVRRLREGYCTVANPFNRNQVTRISLQPEDVDAIVFWLVWSAEKSILEVQDFNTAISMSAQTALRESIGRHELHQMVAEREMLGKERGRVDKLWLIPQDEAAPLRPELLAALSAMGYPLKDKHETIADVHGVFRDGDSVVAVSDHRREGRALAQDESLVQDRHGTHGAGRDPA